MTNTWPDPTPAPEPLGARHLTPIFITINTGDPGLWNAVAAAVGTAVGTPPFSTVTAADIQQIGTPQCPPPLAAAHAAISAMAGYIGIALDSQSGQADAGGAPADIQTIIAAHDPDACFTNTACLHHILEHENWAGHLGETLRSHGYSHYRPAVINLEGITA